MVKALFKLAVSSGQWSRLDLYIVSVHGDDDADDVLECNYEATSSFFGHLFDLELYSITYFYSGLLRSILRFHVNERSRADQ